MFENETLITLSEAARMYPKSRSGKRVNLSVVWRHARIGIKARNGERIKLEHLRFGGRVYTTKEALRRFGQRVAEADAKHFDSRSANESGPLNSAPPPASTSLRKRQIEDANNTLDRFGV